MGDSWLQMNICDQKTSNNTRTIIGSSSKNIIFAYLRIWNLESFGSSTYRIVWMFGVWKLWNSESLKIWSLKIEILKIWNWKLKPESGWVSNVTIWNGKVFNSKIVNLIFRFGNVGYLIHYLILWRWGLGDDENWLYRISVSSDLPQLLWITDQ